MSLQELEAVVQLVRDNPFPEDITELRAAFDAMGAPMPDDVTVEELDCAGARCFRIMPQGADATRIIAYFHGGGYVIGSLTSHGGMVAELAKAAGCPVLFVDYRLAPEHPHPASIEDTLAAYRWLLDAGYLPEKIAFAGDSAGGALTLATAQAARDARLPQPAALAPISPWADLTSSGESHKSRAELDPMIGPEIIANLSSAYLGAQDAAQPSASPVFGDYAGLAPMLIQVGEREVLFSDADMVRKKAEAAGVEVTFEEWKDMIHVWHLFYPMLSEGREAIARVGAYLAGRLGTPNAAGSAIREA